MNGSRSAGVGDAAGGAASGHPSALKGPRPQTRNGPAPDGPTMGPCYFSPDSTRFFSPANARSMMTFSALRLIMPSIGILTSTVRR